MVKELERLVKVYAEYDETTATDDEIELHLQLQRDLPRLEEVCDSLSVSEMLLIWYLRNSGCSTLLRGLLKNLEANYEAVQVVMHCRRELFRLSSEISHEQ